jgi:hypothetical protein
LTIDILLTLRQTYVISDFIQKKGNSFITAGVITPVHYNNNVFAFYSVSYTHVLSKLI